MVYKKGKLADILPKIKQRTVGAIFDAVCAAINILPEKLYAATGRLLGYAVYFAGVRREVARDNLEKALDHLPPGEIDDILKKCYLHLGQIAVEFLLLKDGQRNLPEHFEIQGEDHLEAAREKSRSGGVIIYTAHFGNWEWLGCLISELGYSVTAIARTQKQAAINKRINDIRRSYGVSLADRKKGIKDSIRALKKGDVLIIIGDQHASKGLPLEFFGRKASVHRGAVKLAANYGVPLVPVFSIRTGFASYRLNIEEPLEVSEDLDEEMEKRWLRKLLKITESQIAANPEQWLWLHRRWKV